MALILVQNHHKGPLVFTDDGPPKVQIEWQGEGDPDGKDLQEAPESLVDSVNFRRLISRGVVTVEQASPEVEARLASQGQSWAKQQAAKTALIEDSMDRQANNDIMVLPCAAPGPGGECGTSVMVRETERYDRPPLCQHHDHLTHQFVAHETGEHPREGKPVVTWMRVAAGTPNVVP